MGVIRLFFMWITLLLGGFAGSNEFYLSPPSQMSSEFLSDNPWMQVVYARKKDLRYYITTFLKRDHELKTTIFDQIDNLEEEEILQQAELLLPNLFSKYARSVFYWKMTSLTLKRLFLIPTQGSIDIEQAFSAMSSVYQGREIEEFLQTPAEVLEKIFQGAESIETFLQESIEKYYLILKGIAILSKQKEKVLIESDDIEFLCRVLVTEKDNTRHLLARNILELTNRLLIPPDTVQKQESLDNFVKILGKLSENEEWNHVLGMEEIRQKIDHIRGMANRKIPELWSVTTDKQMNQSL